MNETETAVAHKTEYQPLSVGNWVGTLILTGIPLVGFIMLIVWATGENTQPSKKNYAKASLLVLGICVVLAVLAGIVVAVLGVAVGSMKE